MVDNRKQPYEFYKKRDKFFFIDYYGREHIKRELFIFNQENDLNILVDDIMEIINRINYIRRNFDTGYNILYVIERLVREKPLTPLTGNEEEWEKLRHRTRINKRCRSVYMDDDMGFVYDDEAMKYSFDGGHTWREDSQFQKPLVFPYLPPTYPEKVYFRQIDDSCIDFSPKNVENITNNPEEIQKLYEKKKSI